MLVGGVDFSGAKTDPNDTWLVTGELGSLGLKIRSVKNTGARALIKELDSMAELTECALDFPFGLPVEFMRFLAKKLEVDEFAEWQSLAERLVFMELEEFKAYADEYGIDAKRHTDKIALRAAKSPLHQVNPSMIQMTFYGIKMLTQLNPDRYYVLPFQDEKEDGCAMTEVYPAEILSLLNLPWRGYKGKDKQGRDKALEVRREIVNGIVYLRENGGAKFKECPRVSIDNTLKGQIIASDHAVDAFAACYSAAIRRTTPSLFPDPLDSDNVNVLLEGWMYAPAALAKES